MHTAHIVISCLLALVFVSSGLAKASGNPRALAVTRNVKVGDGVARAVGAIEAIAALGVVIGLRNGFIQWIALVVLWVIMSGAMYFHFRSQDIKSSFPPFFLLTSISIALVTI